MAINDIVVDVVVITIVHQVVAFCKARNPIGLPSSIPYTKSALHKRNQILLTVEPPLPSWRWEKTIAARLAFDSEEFKKLVENRKKEEPAFIKEGVEPYWQMRNYVAIKIALDCTQRD